jgi:urease accessory protein
VGVEAMIALSVVVLGGLVLAQRGFQLAAALVAAAFFALFHGFAHGAEMGGASAPAYFAGFLLGSAMLVTGSSLIGGLARQRSSWAIRPAGAIIASVGVAMLVGII